jgi:hypothetical protein
MDAIQADDPPTRSPSTLLTVSVVLALIAATVIVAVLVAPR